MHRRLYVPPVEPVPLRLTPPPRTVAPPVTLDRGPPL